MTPAARVQAALELLEGIERESTPADRVASAYFRSRRYIGSKDRRAISDQFYRVLRSRARLDWWVMRGRGTGPAVDDAPSARQRLLASLALERGGGETGALFDGSAYGPAAPSEDEQALIAALAGETLDHAEQPDWVRGEMPEWLMPGLRETLGPETAGDLAALAEPATVTLRVNGLKASRDEARQILAEQDIVSRPTPFAPLGLAIEGRHNLPGLPAYRDGLVEIQDEGSQIVALLCDARPGMAVADFCAGGGGKTLALGAAMQDRGLLVALDLDEKRLAQAPPRLARAGLTCVECRTLAPEDDDWLAVHQQGFDRVLVDAPCSGLGTGRRNPEARWRLTPTRLARYRERQQEAMGRAARLVRPGGRLVYATCSLYAPENGAQVSGFLERHPGFRPVPIATPWSAVGLLGACPADGESLLLTPARHGTDGFFVAVLERRP